MLFELYDLEEFMILEVLVVINYVIWYFLVGEL